MVYVGIDLHRNRSQIAVLDQQGDELLSRRIVNDPDIFLELLHGLGDDVQVALEATYGWEWLAELLEEAGYELHLAHPLRTRAIAAARVKTDAVDARTLAHLLRADLLPEAYVAPRELRDLRDLLRHRVALTQLRSALKNRVHALLAKHGVQHGYADLFGKGGSEFLAALELREPPRRRLESSLALIRDFDREIEVATGEIDALAKHDDRVEVLCHARRGPLHRHAGDRRGRRRLSLRFGAQAVRLGRLDADDQKLRRQGPPRAHHQARIAAAALGARRGRPTRRPRRRPAQGQLRADRQAPRPQDRQGRRRAQDPHPLLLRPTRRRDPLPGAPLPAERDSIHGGLLVRSAARLIGAAGVGCDADPRASSPFVMASTNNGRPPT